MLTGNAYLVYFYVILDYEDLDFALRRGMNETIPNSIDIMIALRTVPPIASPC